jgi:hypothetical protein
MSNIAKAIARVMSEVGSVKKGGTNSFHGYKYAKAEDVLHALQPVMASAGLVIIQNEGDVELFSGDTMMKAKYEFTLLHDSGEERGPIIRSGMAAAKNTKGGFDDKALNKCSTAALKYFLVTLFKIPTGDYADADADEDKPGRPIRPVAVKQQEADPFGLPPLPDGPEYDDSASRKAYIEECKVHILNPVYPEAEVRDWWINQAKVRRDFGLSQLEVNLLKSVMAERFKPAKVAAQ